MVVMVWDMGYCGKCGTPNLATVVFCQQCGTANTPPSNTSNAGRPVISMDPRKKGQMSENASGPAVSVPQYQVMPQQISNIAPAQFQSSPITPHVAVSSSNTTKIAIAVVGIIVAISAKIQIHQRSRLVINNLVLRLVKHRTKLSKNTTKNTQVMTIIHLTFAVHI